MDIIDYLGILWIAVPLSYVLYVGITEWGKKKREEITKISWKHWFNWESFELFKKILAVITVTFLVMAVLVT